MFGLDPIVLAIIVLVAVAAGAVCYGLLFSRIETDKKTAKPRQPRQVGRDRPGQGQGCARPRAGNVEAPQIGAGQSEGSREEAAGKYQAEACR